MACCMWMMCSYFIADLRGWYGIGLSTSFLIRAFLSQRTSFVFFEPLIKDAHSIERSASSIPWCFDSSAHLHITLGFKWVLVEFHWVWLSYESVWMTSKWVSNEAHPDLHVHLAPKLVWNSPNEFSLSFNKFQTCSVCAGMQLTETHGKHPDSLCALIVPEWAPCWLSIAHCHFSLASVWESQHSVEGAALTLWGLLWGDHPHLVQELNCETIWKMCWHDLFATRSRAKLHQTGAQIHSSHGTRPMWAQAFCCCSTVQNEFISRRSGVRIWTVRPGVQTL